MESLATSNNQIFIEHIWAFLAHLCNDNLLEEKIDILV